MDMTYTTLSIGPTTFAVCSSLCRQQVDGQGSSRCFPVSYYWATAVLQTPGLYASSNRQRHQTLEALQLTTKAHTILSSAEYHVLAVGII